MSGSKASLRTAYFLGAGVSAAVCRRAVVTKNLLSVALEARASLSGFPDVDVAEELVRFLASRGQEPAIDDVLSLIDVALAADLSLSPAWQAHRLADVRGSLSRLIYDCIQTTVHGGGPTENNPLKVLLSKCQREFGIAIITLNWDCLVELTFKRLHGQRDGLIDYGIPCMNDSGDPFAVDSGALLVLKPHGSLSWGHCPLCGVVVADLTQPFDFTKERPCPICPGVPLQFVLVPPVPFSRPWPWFLSSLWKRVEDAIYDSDRLVFIGYSFPPQDVGVRIHLIRAMARRQQRKGASPLKVEIVTKNESAGSNDAEGTLNRYLSMLGGLVGREHFSLYQQGFSNWVTEIGS